ncbi:MAG: fumarylacetoacetase [Candidatus Sphingomonas phytovorans]|nr:fumarylacetoacetase [Sphingomonas sp.]WEK02314.1 MAG: fumarylacetoacetase [Sphingomonas sp.]
MTQAGIDETHAPGLESWVADANGHSDFPVQNLPFAIFSRSGEASRPGIAIGDHILDLPAVRHLLPPELGDVPMGQHLNDLFALPAARRRALRRQISTLLSDDRYKASVVPALARAEDCLLHLPAAIGDYTDFYVGIHHATNVGRLFRPDNPLLPNYKYIPIGYHGRASSIRPSGVPVIRPVGQSKGPDDLEPRFGPSARLDYELELGIWIGSGNDLGQPIPIGEAADHIAGFSLFNDWSARDFQAWEYVPLGPFLAKNFHSSISPWVITSEALAPFRIAQPPRPEGDPPPLPYLSDGEDQARGALAIDLRVALLSERMRNEGLAPLELSRSAASNMYWTPAQIVAHHSSNGCNLNPGDLMGTGTISGPDPSGFGSLLEITRGGSVPLPLPTGEQRHFLEDGDEVIFNGHAHAQGFVSIGLGECRARILPATPSATFTS